MTAAAESPQPNLLPAALAYVNRRWRRVGGRMYLDVARQTNEMAAD